MKPNQLRKMVLCSMMAALMSICGWISLPVPPIPVTMQTFGVLLTLGLLGGKWGTVSIGLYLLLGILGLPVFTGFRGGVGALLDATGGFLWGFLAAGLTYWFLERLGRLPAMIAGLLACYACGCWWFSLWAGGTGFWAAMTTCVLPYGIPDGVKLVMAFRFSSRLARRMRL